MAMSGFPNIPDFKGLVTSGTNAALNLGGAAIINAVFGNVWGLVNEYGAPIVLADGVLGISYNNTSIVANVPIENGSFASYNKVSNPKQAVVQMSKGSGGALERGAFLAQLEAYQGSTLNFTVVTPEFVCRNMNITGLSWARSASEGLQLIVANLQLEEVRNVGVNYSYEEVKNPSDAKSVDGGEVQPTNQSDNTSILKRLFG